MTLQTLIIEKLATQNLHDVAKKLGYSNEQQLSARLDLILASSYLALDKSGFDFHYSTPELIRKLCHILSIPDRLCNNIISEIEVSLEASKNRFKSYIYIETNFKRSSQPIFMLAALNSQRYIPIDDELQKLPLNEQIEHVQRLLKAHYAQQTALQIWGEIDKYVYFYDENTIVIFSPSGRVIDTVDEYFVSRPILSLKH
jgi:hypothetical protein